VDAHFRSGRDERPRARPGSRRASVESRIDDARSSTNC
jgi:hypothetical protein